MGAGIDQPAVLADQFHGLAGVLIVEYQAVEKGVEVDAAIGFGGAMHAAGIGHAFTHQVFDFAQVLPELFLLGGVVHELGPQLHAGDGGLQVMGNRRQQLHAFLEIGGDTRLHGIEGRRRVGHFGRTGFVQVYTVGIGVEVFHGMGQARQRAYGNAHRQPGAAEHQQQLAQQDKRQPGRHGHDRRGDVEGQRAAVTQFQVGLEVFARAGDVTEGQQVVTSDGLFERGYGDRHFIRLHGDAGNPFIQQVAVVVPFKARQPAFAFVCRQAFKNGDGGRDIGFQVAEHGALGALIALVGLRAEGQRLGEDQPGEEDQRQT